MDIITFYNEIFIPAAKPLLVDVGSAGTTVKASNVPEVGNNKDGIVFFFLKKLFCIYSCSSLHLQLSHCLTCLSFLSCPTRSMSCIT